jgi:hypothetical protein
MGFFDQYKDESVGGGYIKPEEKAVIIRDQLPLTLVRGFYTKDGGFEGKPAYKLIVEFEGEERGLSFGITEGGGSRDRMIEGMLEYMDVDETAKPEGWEPPVFTIQKGKGGYQLLVPVSG